MSLNVRLRAIRGEQPGVMYCQFKNECTVMISYVQNLMQKGADIMSSLQQDSDTRVTSLKTNYIGIMNLHRLLDKIQKINNFALELGSDDESEEEIDNNVLSDAVTPTFNESSSVSFNPTSDESSGAAVSPAFDESSPVLCNIQIGDILDMVYISGNNPYEFWLGYYSTTTLDEVIKNLTSRCKEGQLRLCHNLYTGLHVCVCDGQQCYRAKIVNLFYKDEVQVSVLNIDNGKRDKVKKESIYHLDSDISAIPVQGLSCRLQGSLGDPSLWNDVVASLFSQILTKSNLVVTVTARLPGEPPQFVVEVDCHNEERKINKLELSKWITTTVFPKLREVKQKLMPYNRETLHSLFTCLDSVTALLEVAADDYCLQLEENFAISACVLKSKLQQLSNSKANEGNDERSHGIDTSSTMALELANGPKSKLENSRFVLDWNLPQSDTLPAPITPVTEKSLLSQRQQTTSPVGKVTISPNKFSTSLHWNDQHDSASASLFTENSLLSQKQMTASPTDVTVSPNRPMCSLQSDDLCKMALPDSKNFLALVDTTVKQDITNNKLGDSSSFIIGNGISTKPEQEKSDFILLQPVLVSTIGQSYDVMLAHIENPAEFYIHIVCEENVKIDDLHFGMNDYYNSINVSFKSKSEAKKYVGTYCAAYYTPDKQWCRGLIMDWNEAGDDLDISVKFVDYGNVSPVPLAAIQPLRQKFATLPICAQQCHLANIHPVESTSDNIVATWSLESTNLFKCLVDINTVYSIVLTESSNGSCESIPVLLEYNHDGNRSVINKSMVELGYAVHFSPIDVPLYVNAKKKTIAQSTEVSSVSESAMKEDINVVEVDLLQNAKEMDILDSWDPMAEDFYSEMNTVYHDDEDASYVVTGYKPQDEKRVCKLFATKGYCYKGKTCLKEHTFLHPDGWTTDKEAIFGRAFNELILPVAGSDIILDVTQVVKSNVFWAVVREDVVTYLGRRGHGETAEMEEKEEEEETLVTLTNYLNQDCNVKKLQRLNVTPALGQIVVALYTDGLYYRARVIDHGEEDVLVIFVDFGNQQWVKMSDVRDIEPRYLHLPFQAVECMIVNVEPLSGEKDNLGRQFLHNIVKDVGIVHARVILSCNDALRMEVLISDLEGCDLGQRLIRGGFCKERNYMVSVSHKDTRVLPA